jgi:type III secretion system FlhB-like substrate exporter
MKSRYSAAVGISYTHGIDNCPTLSVKAEHLLADRVVKMAKRYGIPVVERPELARALLELRLDTSIPEEFFEAVALVLAEVEAVLKK